MLTDPQRHTRKTLCDYKAKNQSDTCTTKKAKTDVNHKKLEETRKDSFQ